MEVAALPELIAPPVTVILKVNAPARVGIPEMLPVVELSDNPAGVVVN